MSQDSSSSSVTLNVYSLTDTEKMLIPDDMSLFNNSILQCMQNASNHYTDNNTPPKYLT